MALVFALLVFPMYVWSARDYPPEIPDSRVDIYKSVDGVYLRVWIFEPTGHLAAIFVMQGHLHHRR